MSFSRSAEFLAAHVRHHRYQLMKMASAMSPTYRAD